MMSSLWWLVGLVVAVGPPKPGGAGVGMFDSNEWATFDDRANSMGGSGLAVVDMVEVVGRS